MKKFFFLLFFFCASPLCAQNQDGKIISRVQAQTTRMNPKVLLERFPLKPGDRFTAQAYDRAQDELHDMRVFKKLDFTLTPRPDNKLDINISAEDGYFIFPLAFASGGGKSVAALSLAAGNLFKQGEMSFFFGGVSQDGFTVNAGTALGKHSFYAGYSKINTNQRFYKNDWSNTFGVFSTSDDEGEYTQDLLAQVHTRKESFTFSYTRKLTPDRSLFLRPELARYQYADSSLIRLDPGAHNTLTAGLQISDNIRKGANMGALSGYGLTDKKKSLTDLPKTRFGHAGKLFYTDGGSWSASDYRISKLGMQATWLAEFKTRHLLALEIKAQNAFQAHFSDEILSTDLLSGQGRYDRQLRGQRGAGASAGFVYYLLRNNTGLLSLAPFYETAYVYRAGRYLNHSGAGATLSYKLWRFPFPVGINYTHNLTDGSHQTAFVFGGAF